MTSLVPPILIVGSVRSGTTMLQDCLRLLEGVTTWLEPRTVWKMGNVGCNHDELTEDMATARVVRRIRKKFLEYQESHGGRRIVEKTPSNVVRIRFAHKVLPEAKFLHIYRHGLDSVSSTLGGWRKGHGVRRSRLKQRLRETAVWEWPYYFPRYVRDLVAIRLGLTDRLQSYGVVYRGMQRDVRQMDLVEVVAKQWVNAVETAHAQLGTLNPDLWIETRYETLVAQPREEFQRILGFFGLPMTPALEQHLRNNIHQGVVGVYKKRLSSEQITKAIPIVRPTMERLGYDVEATPV